MSERNGAVTFKGNAMTLVGDEVMTVGAKAPAITLSKGLTEDCTMADLAGKKVILTTVPSLDTSVCSVQAARFNSEAASLGDDVVVVVASADLPPAQARWCQANTAENIMTVSDYKHHEMAQKSGLLIKELGLLARAVFVIDGEGTIRYAEVVKEITEEPNYDAALQALKEI